MSSHYYLAASLPMLHFHQGDPPISVAQFLDLCRRLTPPQDFSRIHSARLGASETAVHPSGVLAQWQQAEFGIRNELVRVRARRKGIAPEPYLRTDLENPLWAGRIREVFEEFSPLRAELHLLRLFWEVLEDLVAGHQFDTGFLVVYHLKLQILERKASFNPQIGSSRLTSLVGRGEAHGF